jgi:hypothetical protein
MLRNIVPVIRSKTERVALDSVSLLLGTFGLCLIFFGTAFAAPDAGPVPIITPDDPSQFFESLFAAFTGQHWVALAAMALVGTTWAIRRSAAALGWGWLRWVLTKRGGAALVMGQSLAGAVAYAALGGALSPKVVLYALEAGFFAAGGWTWVRDMLNISAAKSADGIGTVPGVEQTPVKPQ